MPPSLDFRGQPFDDDDTVAAFIERATLDPSITHLTIVVAWARFRGLVRVRNHLDRFNARGGALRIILGIDEGGATRPGLLLAEKVAGEAYVFHEPAGGTFHPKMYFADGPSRALLLVGSGNATAGGLYGNYEAALEARFALPEEESEPALVKTRDYIARLLAEQDLCRRLDRALIDELVADGRFRVAGHERPRRSAQPGGTPGADEHDQSGSEGAEGTGSPFGRRRSSRVAIPPLPPGSADELAAMELPEEEAEPKAEPHPATSVAKSPDGGAEQGSTTDPSSAGGGSGTTRGGGGAVGAPPGTSGPTQPPTPASAATTVETWSKELPRGDAQQTRSGTNPTGNLRLTQAGQSIDWTTWFRQVLFATASWRRGCAGTVDPRRPQPAHRASIVAVR